MLLDTFKPLAIKEGWLWVGTDLSESTSISEERIAIRLITDLAVVTSGIVVRTEEIAKIGFQSARTHQARTLNFELMCDLYKKTPGLVSDKLKTVLELVWQCLRQRGLAGSDLRLR